MDGGAHDDTLTSPINRRAAPAPMPGVVVVFAARRPSSRTALARRGPVTLGRDPGCGVPIADPEMSRRHADVQHLGEQRWRITDHGTKNGTYVNGVAIRGGTVEHEGAPLVIRTGGSLGLLDDISRYATAQLTVGASV